MFINIPLTTTTKVCFPSIINNAPSTFALKRKEKSRERRRDFSLKLVLTPPFLIPFYYLLVAYGLFLYSRDNIFNKAAGYRGSGLR